MAECHCCCRGMRFGSGSATLWRLNPSTGGVIWASDLTSNASAFYVTGDTIYEVGASGKVRRVTNTGTTWEVDWAVSLASTATVTDVEMSVADGVLWVVQPSVAGGARFSRIDPDDGSVLSSGQPIASTLSGHLYDAPGGSMNYFRGIRGAGTGGLYQIDDTFSVTASWTTLSNASGAAAIDGDALNGWIIMDTTGGTVLQLDSSLSEVSDSADDGGVSQFACTDTMFLGALEDQQSAPGVAMGVDIASWTEQWEMPIGVGATLLYDGTQRLEGDAVFAMGEKSGGQECIARFDSGVQTWTTDIFPSAPTNVRVVKLIGDNVLAGGVFPVTSGGPSRSVASFAKVGGAMNWAVGLYGATIQDVWESGTNLYAVGNRVTLG